MATTYAAAPRTLDTTALERFGRDGYLAYEGVLTPAEVAQTCETLSELIRGLHAAAIVGSPLVEVVTDTEDRRENYRGVGLKRAGGAFQMTFQTGVDPFSIKSEEAELKIRKLQEFRNEHPLLLALSQHPRVMAIVESIIGPASILFQDMALIKPPYIGSAKPWHQDDAYFSYAPLDQVVGVWLSLDSATARNGCMHVLPGGHRRGGFRHYQSSLDCEIVPGRIKSEEAVAIELEPGGALFFSGMLPHETPPNRSPLRRRALQFHYRGASTKKVDKAEYDRLFVEADGTPASCRANEG